jgi:hypothetical protein
MTLTDVNRWLRKIVVYWAFLIGFLAIALIIIVSRDIQKLRDNGEKIRRQREALQVRP